MKSFAQIQIIQSMSQWLTDWLIDLKQGTVLAIGVKLLCFLSIYGLFITTKTASFNYSQKCDFYKSHKIAYLPLLSKSKNNILSQTS